MIYHKQFSRSGGLIVCKGRSGCVCCVCVCGRVKCNVAKTPAGIYVALSFSGLCHSGVQCTKKYLITRCPLLLKYKGKARRYIALQKPSQYRNAPPNPGIYIYIK